MSYTPDQVSEITLLRHERWALYASLADIKQAPRDPLYDRIAARLAKINQALFVLTENPIYQR
jgi:hypothetical protein